MMWDVIVTLTLMFFGAFVVLVVGAVTFACVYYVQNEATKRLRMKRGRDD
jgi:hypothetical protein